MAKIKAASAEAAELEMGGGNIPTSTIPDRMLRVDNTYGNGCWYACQGADISDKRKGWHPGRWVRHYLPGSRMEHLEQMCDVAIQRHRARGCLIADLAWLNVRENGGETP